MDRVESIQEKMYDFEVNKRNNLLFYGIKEDRRETPAELYNKVIKETLLLFSHRLSSDQSCYEGELDHEKRYCH